MELMYVGMALFLLFNLSIGLIRVVRGPTDCDRMLAAQLFGTTAVAILLVLGEVTEKIALQNVALVFALLSAVTAIAFVRHSSGGED